MGSEKSRILLGKKGSSCKNRLDRLGLHSPEDRRLRRNLKEVYKSTRGLDKVNSKGLIPQMDEFKTRGHIFYGERRKI